MNRTRLGAIAPYLLTPMSLGDRPSSPNTDISRRSPLISPYGVVA
ncbi:hypothetical protein [Thermoleptolyngbya sp.]